MDLSIFAHEIDGLLKLCMENRLTRAINAKENRWTEAFFLLKLMDYRRFYAFGHLWPFYSVKLWI